MSVHETIADQAMTYLLAGDLENASALVTKNLPDYQNDPAFLYVAGWVAREVRDTGAAKQILSRLLSIAPAHASAHELMYKIYYDEADLEKALHHAALGSRLQPPSTLLKLVALQQVCGSTVKDNWLADMCNELLAMPLPSERYQQAAAILSAAGYYDMALIFLRRGFECAQQPGSHKTHPDAFANDIQAVRKLQRGEALALPLHSPEMRPCPPEAYSGPPVTVFVTSHFSTKITKNAAKAPPCTDMLAETLTSFRQHAALPADWPMVICFDAPKIERLTDEQKYIEGLQPILKEYNATLRTYRGAGLRNVFMDVFKDITTPYFMMLEHDWLCTGPIEPLPELVRVMDTHHHIHHIRYTRHNNHINNTEWYFMYDSTVSTLPLFHSPTYSNNPSITRVAKFKRDWLPKATASNEFMMLNGGAGGLEEAIIDSSFRFMDRWGIYANLQAQGVCVIGQPNSKPRLIHTGV